MALITSETFGSLIEDIAGIVGTRTEARDLIAALLDRPRSWPSVHADEALPSDVVVRARAAAHKRKAGAPLAYAVGRAAFRNLTLYVDERVLIPRPETEVLVDLVLADCQKGTVIDLGTGSGAIALALATEGEFARVIGTDISTDALAVAHRNAGAMVELRQGSWLAPVQGLRVQAVVSNPPYISYDDELDASVRDWEPSGALLAADNGMAAIREIVRGAPDVLVTGGLLALEVDARRAAIAVEMVQSDGRYEDVRVRLDLTGRERFVLARHTGSPR
ncbi:MAG TPA: peptide chain release factor N(5)-glutamine methyltransferase [Gemmatimonadaceae bacterium]|nr:peptide chain release factor N(5)-glutamine methyltransferase [Gemmatimonadaceae bacterium]